MGRASSIGCVGGDDCPEDRYSDAFSTDFVSRLCYLSEENGDAHCYDYSYNPYVSTLCYGIYCWAKDKRGGKWASGWAWGDLGGIYGVKPSSQVKK